MRVRHGSFAASVGLLLGVLGACSEPEPGTPPATPGPFLVENARVVDGTGQPAEVASVRVRNGTIVGVGELEPLPDEETIDGAGLVLAPGFIDTHSHYDYALAELPVAEAAVSQGVTTIVVGVDGSSQLPLAELFESVERAVAVNVASYVGHGTVRQAVLGDDFRRPATDDEIAEMAGLVEQELAAGALGLSSGLEYDPGIYATTDEVLRLAEVARAAGGRYATHLRSEDRHLFEAIEEAIEIGSRAHIPVQISHLKLAMHTLWGRADEVLARLDRARREGVSVTADVYPYEYWQSTMTVLFPDRNFDDRSAAELALTELTTPEDFVIAQYEPEPDLIGKTLAQVAAERSQDPVTTYLELIAESQRLAAEVGHPTESIIATSMATEDVNELLAWPHSNVCSDGALTGLHPRGYGAFTRVLSDLVRDRGVLTLEQAVFKMTGLAADHVGLSDRGRIAVGAPADLVLLDPATVDDRATPQAPNALSTGIERVWVNGELVYLRGRVTGRLPGTALRRPTS